MAPCVFHMRQPSICQTMKGCHRKASYMNVAHVDDFEYLCIISQYKCTHVCNYVVPCHHIGTAWRPSVLSSLPILEHSSIWQIQHDRIKRLRSKSSQYHGAFHYQIVRASIWTERTTRWRNLLMSFVDRLSSEERLDISMIKCSAAEAIKNPKLFLWLNQLQLSHYKKCAIANAQVE